MKVSKNDFIITTALFLISYVSSLGIFVHYIMIVPDGPIEIFLQFGTLIALLLYPLFFAGMVLLTAHNPYVFEDVFRLYEKQANQHKAKTKTGSEAQ
jgi:hypothetical protein